MKSEMTFRPAGKRSASDPKRSPALAPVAPATHKPRPLFAFAGSWHRWQGPIRKDGPPVDIELYGFLTTFPNALTQTVAVAGHPD